jgi:excisionase family DNA binding protein
MPVKPKYLNTIEKPSDKGPEPLVGAVQAAEFLDCNERTLRKYAERKQVPAMRMGNEWKFLISVLDAWRKEKLMSNCSEFSVQEER